MAKLVSSVLEDDENLRQNDHMNHEAINLEVILLPDQVFIEFFGGIHAE